MFGFDDWTELSKPRDLAKIFDTAEYMKWRSFRETEDSRFVSLVMPRVVARLPYGKETKPIDEFAYEEAPFDEVGAAKPMGHHDYCWMNAAFVMGARMTDAFAQYGFCTMIRGAEGGGKVENLPSHLFKSDDGDTDSKCPTEIGITDRREFGTEQTWLPLPGATTRTPTMPCSSVPRPRRSRRSTTDPKPPPTPSDLGSACLISWQRSRFAHYLKIMARDMGRQRSKRRATFETRSEPLDQQLCELQPEASGAESMRAKFPAAPRPRSRSRRSRVAPAPTTRWRGCGRGCRWKS